MKKIYCPECKMYGYHPYFLYVIPTIVIVYHVIAGILHHYKITEVLPFNINYLLWPVVISIILACITYIIDKKNEA